MEKYGGPEQAEERLTEAMQALFDMLDKTRSYGLDDDSIFGPMRDMYAVYLAQQHSAQDTPGWMGAYRSYDAFFSTVVPQATLNARAMWTNYMRLFQYRINVIKRFVESPTEREWRDEERVCRFYGLDGEWNLVESTDPLEWERPGSHHFIEKRLAEESQRLVKNGYRACDLSHMTSTPALDGIAHERAIVASESLHEAGKPPKTGEYITQASNDKHRTLSQVYASNGDPTWGYQTLRWFDERPIGFGINREKQREAIRAQKIEMHVQGAYQEQESDWGSEGILVGREVPLENIDRVYCLQGDMERMSSWVKQHCPSAQLVCWDAVDFLHTYGWKMEKAALANGTTPQKEWDKLFDQLRPVTVKREKE